MRFLVTNLGEDEIILGYPWLAAFKPNIDWAEAVLEEDMQPLVIKTLGHDNMAIAQKSPKHGQQLQENWLSREKKYLLLKLQKPKSGKHLHRHN